MHRSSFLASLALASMSGVAFAAADKGAGSNPAPTPPAPPAPAVPAVADAPKAPKAIVLGVTTGIARPENSATSKSSYPFDTLVVDGSFGVKNRDKKSFNSIIYMAHNRFVVDAPVDPVTGLVPTVVKVKKDKKTGVETRETVNKKVRTREFEAFDVDPATDPEGASVRIFRNK